MTGRDAGVVRTPRVGCILVGAERHDSGVMASDSAFAISGPYVLTAWHCVRDVQGEPLWFRWRLPGSSYYYVPVRVANRDETIDVAVLTVDAARLAEENLSAIQATELLAEIAIPLGQNVRIADPVRVMGFPANKPGYDSDTLAADVVEPDYLLGDVTCLKLQGPELAASVPVDGHGLSGGPVLRARDRERGASGGEVAVGLVRWVPQARKDDYAALGGALLAARIGDARRLPEIAEALRTDAIHTRRVPRYRADIDVRRAKGGLRGRSAELAELAAFTRPGPATGSPYGDWVAEPWAGKTALAAQFAGNPPPGVDVVAFFVAPDQQTSRFLFHVCDQLAALLDEPKPALADLDGAMLSDLWDRAGKQARAAGRTLVLLIDGLDKNNTSPPRIADFIPADSDQACRVVVFRRDPPELLLSPGHPLADARARKELRRSEHAAERRAEAMEALGMFLGQQHAIGTLGMLAAAGELCAEEIAELLCLEQPGLGDPGLLSAPIRNLLDIGLDTGLLWPLPEDPDRYAFQHDTLREWTTAKVTKRAVTTHLKYVKRWADEYAAQDWPEDTPRYLTSGYPEMLVRTSDTDRLVALATPARRRRLLAITGDDAAAGDELTKALGQIAASDPPELPQAGRLALRREQFLGALAWYPVNLVTAHAALRHWQHAEQLASHLGWPEARADCLMVLAQSAAAAAEPHRADRLFLKALKEVVAGSAPMWRNDRYLALARYSAAASRPIHAQVIASTVTDPDETVRALSAFAHIYAVTGHVYYAGQSVIQACRTAERLDAVIPDPPPPHVYGLAADPAVPDVATRQAAIQAYWNALTTIVQAAAVVTQHAADHLDTALLVARAVPLRGRFTQLSMIADIGRAAAAAGRDDAVTELLEEAREQALRLSEPGERLSVQAEIAQAAAVAAGQPAAPLIAASTDPAPQPTGLAAIMQAAVAGDAETARERALKEIPDPAQQASVLAAAAQSAAAAGQPAADLIAAAYQAAARVADPAQHAWVLGDVVQGAISARQFDLAAVAAADMAAPAQQAGALAAIIQAIMAGQAGVNDQVPAAGDRRAQTLIAAARQTAADIANPAERAAALAALAHAVLAGGQDELAGQLVKEADEYATAAVPVLRAGVLAAVAEAVAGDQERSARLFDAACRACAAPDPLQGAMALAEVARHAREQAAWPGFLWAQANFTAQITDPLVLSMVRRILASAAAESGQDEMADAITAGIVVPAQRIFTLLELGQSATARGQAARSGGLFTAAAETVTQARLNAGAGTSDFLPWAPVTIAEAAASSRQLTAARSAAAAITEEAEAARVQRIIGAVAEIEGDEPSYFLPSFLLAPDDTLGLMAEAACGAGWREIATFITMRVRDPIRRGYLLAMIGEAALKAGDQARASAVVQAAAPLMALADRGARNRLVAVDALAAIARGDRDSARATLATGFTDCFSPDLLAIAVQLDARTADAIVAELGGI